MKGRYGENKSKIERPMGGKQKWEWQGNREKPGARRTEQGLEKKSNRGEPAQESEKGQDGETESSRNNQVHNQDAHTWIEIRLVPAEPIRFRSMNGWL